MNARTLLSTAILLCPLLASAQLLVDKTHYSLTFGAHWTDGLGSAPEVPTLTLLDTVHEAAGHLQGMPVIPGTTADGFFQSVTLTFAGQMTREDSSTKRLGGKDFKTSDWTNLDPDVAEENTHMRLYTLSEGGFAFIAWVAYQGSEGEPAVAEFEAALATLQLKSVAIRKHPIRSGEAGAGAFGAAGTGAKRLDLLGRTRTPARGASAGMHFVSGAVILFP